MGRISRMFALAVMTAGLGGCAALSTVAAIPSAVVDGAVSLFKAEEEGLPASLSKTLAAVQQGLRRMELDVDILEPESGRKGYRISFGTDRLDGLIKLERQTPKLTTVSVQVRHGALREEAVEKAIMKEVRTLAERRRGRRRFNFRGYRHIHEKPDVNSRRIGWYRPGARLEVAKSRREGWLRIRMPSKHWGFIRARIGTDTKKLARH